MSSAWQTWSSVSCLALALIACQRENPAFDPDGGGADGGTDDDGESSTTQTSTTQTSTTQGDGDGDGDAGDGDGDGDTDPDTGMEAPVEDLPTTMCEVETHEGLWPRVGKPEQFPGGTCPSSYGGFVRVAGLIGANWIANQCPGGCGDGCDQAQMQMGADGLALGLAELIPPVAFDPNMSWIGCYYVEAVDNIKTTDDGCFYASFSVHTDEGPGSPLLFHANRDNRGLTPNAAMHYANWSPTIIDQEVDQCACDDLDIDCCAGQTVIAKQFLLAEPVAPPGGTGSIIINQSPFIFYAAQAQSGTNCAIDPEVSWALWADG
jgi:hypothetical protein